MDRNFPLSNFYYVQGSGALENLHMLNIPNAYKVFKMSFRHMQIQEKGCQIIKGNDGVYWLICAVA